MPVRHNPQPLFRDLFTPEAVAARGGRPAAGMFLSSGDPTTAEICAGAGLDYLLIDAEHAPLTLQDVLAQLRTIAGYRVPTLVRVPALDTVAIKQFLDLGAQTLLVPMVDDAAMARRAVAAARYPDGSAEGGVRGVGSALARSGRWNRIPGYLPGAADHVSVIVQIETAAGVRNADEIAAVDGIDGVFIGPAVTLTNDHFPRAVNPDGSLKSAADWEPVGVTIDEGASIGARAVCVAPVHVGAWATVAAT